MKVKGPALVSLQSFILSEFGAEEGYHEWFNSLSSESKEIYKGKPQLDKWYPLAEGLEEPTQKICDLFYKGKAQGAWASGRYSADFALNTLMRIFISVTSVSYIVKKSAKILTRYYEPCEAEVVVDKEKEAVVRITNFDEMSTMIENRIAGYMQRAAELTGGHDVNVFIGPSITRAHSFTEFKVQWK